MKGKNNDFSISFYFGGQRVLFLRYVHDTEKSLRWATARIVWDTCVVYNRRTREKLQTLKNVLVNSDFSLTFVNTDLNERVLHLSDVPNVANAIQWALSKGISFHYVNVYSKLTRNFIERIYL